MNESLSREMKICGEAPERPIPDFFSFAGASSTPAGTTFFAQSLANAP